MGYNLERFISAQRSDYNTALAEIRDGRKRSHWMWYIFPQVRGLGMSGTAQYYAIRNLDEAKAYLEDPYLRGNLIEICEALLALDSNDAREIFGGIDSVKLRSSMTLFDCADPSIPVFRQVLDKYYSGEKDGRTLEILGLQGQESISSMMSSPE